MIASETRESEAASAAEAKARPLSEVANAYLDSVKLRLRSCSIESRTRCHIIPKLGKKPVGEVTRADIVEFLDGLERKEGLRHQINRCRETLRAIFAYAIERDLVAVNPVVGCRNAQGRNPSRAYIDRGRIDLVLAGDRKIARVAARVFPGRLAYGSAAQ